MAESGGYTGAWGYRAGTSGTPVLPAEARILTISAACSTAATLTINGGDSIPIPAGASATLEPRGNLISPTLVFTGTETYFVEYVR